MKTKLRTVRLLATLAIGLLAACADSTGTPAANIEGTYNVSAKRTRFGSSILVDQMPGSLYDGPFTSGGVQYNVAQRLQSASIVLVNEGRRYTYTGTFSISEMNNLVPRATTTVTETGTYVNAGDKITFTPSSPSTTRIAADATLEGQIIIVSVSEPHLFQRFELEFTR